MSSPLFAATREAHAQQWRPNEAKNKLINQKKIKRERWTCKYKILQEKITEKLPFALDVIQDTLCSAVVFFIAANTWH